MIKRILLNVQLLQVWNTYFDLLCRANITDLHVHDVFAVGVNLGINCLFSLLHSLLVFFLGFLLLFDDPFDSFVIEFSDKSVNAGFGIDRETELQLKELVGRVDVFLLKCYACQSVGDLNVVVDMFQRHSDMRSRFNIG